MQFIPYLICVNSIFSKKNKGFVNSFFKCVNSILTYEISSMRFTTLSTFPFLTQKEFGCKCILIKLDDYCIRSVIICHNHLNRHPKKKKKTTR